MNLLHAKVPALIVIIKGKCFRRKWGKTTVDASNEFSLNPTGGKDYQTRRNLPGELF